MASQKRKRARKKKRQLRSVFVLARPLTIADKLRMSFVSDGKFPLCHWAMLVSRSKEGGMMDKLETVRRGGHGGQLGTLFELVRNKSDNTAHMNQYFGPAQLNSDWRYLSIAYIGVTGLSDEIIEDHGINIENTADLCSSQYHSIASEVQRIQEQLSKLHPLPLGTHMPWTVFPTNYPERGG